MNAALLLDTLGSNLRRGLRLRSRRECPSCGSRRLTRSGRCNLVERGMGLLVLPYRCVDCNLRFFRFRSQTVANLWQGFTAVWGTQPAVSGKKAAG